MTSFEDFKHETHLKQVKGKTVLVPSFALLAQHVSASFDSDRAALRQRLASEHGADYTCPVTVQRYFKLRPL